MKDSCCVLLLELKRACLVWMIGEDSGRLWEDFHDCCRDRSRLLVAPPERAILWISAGRTLLLSWLLADRWKSSENMGAVSGEEPGPPLLERRAVDVVDAVSDIVSLLDAGRFLIDLERSSTCGSIASRLICSQPFCILTVARASRSCRVRVI